MLGLVLLLSAVAYYLYVLRHNKLKNRAIAFYHPNCSDGGGGEFVLWAGISSLCRQKRLEERTNLPPLSIVIYTSERSSPQSVLDRARRTFGDSALADVRPDDVSYVRVRTAWLLTHKFHRATLLLQSLGGLISALECLGRLTPDVFVDTTGNAFALPVFRFLGGCRVAAYVHYPTISTDMIRDVATGDSDSVCNKDAKGRGAAGTRAKLWYYRVFAWAYGMAGHAAHATVANGTWTANHLTGLWGRAPTVVYPPCSLPQAGVSAEHLAEKMRSTGTKLVVSIGQFRQEKRQLEQVVALHRMLLTYPELWGKVKLVFVGGVRVNTDDGARKEAVRKLAAERGLIAAGAVEIPDHDVGDDEKRALLSAAVAGLHSMKDEHFGICVAEYMAYGVVPIAHDSAGPKLDIVVPAMTAQQLGGTLPDSDEVEAAKQDGPVGFLADTPQDYSECLHAVLTRPKLAEAMANRGMARVSRFSLDSFRDGFSRVLLPLLG